MSPDRTPTLDARRADDVVRALRARLPAYAPGWTAEEQGPGGALVRVFARYVETLAGAVNAAPRKNELAYLDMLGVNLLRAQAARTPVVFQPMPAVGDGRAPERTRVGATPAGGGDPIVFETENAIAIAAARLAEVYTLWPGRDAYADHVAAATGGRPFALFEPLRPVPHELYLAHETLFAFAGHSTVEIELELESAASDPLALTWEHWDGSMWRGFKPFRDPARACPHDSVDGTAGLTRSGIVRLVTDCGDSEPTLVGGLKARWIRARSTRPLVAASGRRWPTIDRVTVATVVVEPLERLTLTTAQAPPTAHGLFVSLDYFSATADFWRPDGQHVRDEIPRAASWEDLPPGGYRVCITKEDSAPLDFEFALEAEGPNAAYEVAIDREPAGAALDGAFADASKLDPTKTFFPFGPQPQPGGTFYFKNAAFGKPGAAVTIIAEHAETAADAVTNAVGDSAANPAAGVPIDSEPLLVAEYWDGGRWQQLDPVVDDDEDGAERLLEFFVDGGTLDFRIPTDVAPAAVNGDVGPWLRVRIVDKGFVRRRTIAINGVNVMIVEPLPPALVDVRVGFEYRSERVPPQSCLVHNDFRWENRTPEAQWRGEAFAPFRPGDDTTPALYLGFDRPLPLDLVSIFLDVEERDDDAEGPALVWEYHDGASWLPLPVVRDETHGLTRPGIVAVTWPALPPPPPVAVTEAEGTSVRLADARAGTRFVAGDELFIAQGETGELVTVAAATGGRIDLRAPLRRSYKRATIGVAALPRFGTPRVWMRGRLAEDAEPPRRVVRGIHPNAVWVSQLRSIENEVLGSGNGEPDQRVFFRYSPVLEGEVVEVRELDGPRAAVELPMLRLELAAAGFSDDDVREVVDRRTGRVVEVWVRWRERPNLFFSAAGDRHYVVERSRGRLLFGDDRHGRVAPAGANNVMARSYRAGGGVAGNVADGAVKQLLSGVLAQGVTNPRSAEGGADGEVAGAVLVRGPHVVRHRSQALSLDDYESLAREASPAVAVARALPATHPSGRRAAGWVRIVVVPQSADARPQPTYELRRQVQHYLAQRAPAGLAARITVTGPSYLAVGVAAAVAPLDAGAAGAVAESVTRRLAAFLHPLTGGPDGAGWPFGRDVFLSDVAALVEGTEGVDFARTLDLLLDGTPAGEQVAIPADRIVVAGPLRVTLAAAER